MSVLLAALRLAVPAPSAAQSAVPAAPAYGASVVARILALDVNGGRRESGNTILVEQPAVVGFDGLAGDTLLSVADAWIDGRWFDVMPDTAQRSIVLDVLLTPRFVAFDAGRHIVTATLGPRSAWARMPLRQEFIAIDYAEGNEASVVGRPPVVTFSLPDEAEGVPVAYLPRLDFSEPVRNVAGRVELSGGAGDDPPIRLAGVGTNPDGTPRLYPDLATAGADVAVRSVTIIPDEPLRYDTRYRVSLRAGIVDEDTTARGTPDPQPLSSSDGFDFRTYRPRVTASELVAASEPGAKVSAHASRVYLAGPGSDEGHPIMTAVAERSGRLALDTRGATLAGVIRGFAMVAPPNRSPRLVTGMAGSDGRAGLTVFSDDTDSLRLQGLVPLPPGTRIAAMASLGFDVYVATERGDVHVIGVEGSDREPGRPPAEGTVAGTISAPNPRTHAIDIAAADVVSEGRSRTWVVTVGADPLLAVADPETLRIVGVLDRVPGLVEGRAVALATMEGRPVAVVAGAAPEPGRGSLVVVDLADPRAPSVLRTVVIEGSPRDVLVREPLVLVSTDTRTTIFRMGPMGLGRIGEIEDFGGQLAWTNGDEAIVATGGGGQRVNVRTARLAPGSDVYFADAAGRRATGFMELDSLGHLRKPLDVVYRISDPPPVGVPYLLVEENDSIVVSMLLRESSAGKHAVPFPEEVTFQGPVARPRPYVTFGMESLVGLDATRAPDATFTRPDGSATEFVSLPNLYALRSGPAPSPRPSAPSTWNVHDPQIDSVIPSHVPAGVPVTVRIYGSNLDGVVVDGWRPDPAARAAGEDGRSYPVTWRATRHPITPAPGGGTLLLPDSLVAAPGLLYFRVWRDGPAVPFLVVDPTLPRMGTADPVVDPRVSFEFNDTVVRPGGYDFRVAARSTPGDTYVLGRDSTPGFVLGMLPDPTLGPDSFVVAALTPDRRKLSPPIPIHTIPVGRVGVPFENAMTDERFACSELDRRLELPGGPFFVDAVSVIGPRTLEVTGVGLSEGVAITFHQDPSYVRGDSTATGRLTRIETIPPSETWVACGLPDLPWQRARLVFPMEPFRDVSAHIVWRPRGGPG